MEAAVVDAPAADPESHMGAEDALVEEHVISATEPAEVAADAAVIDGPEWPEGSGRVGEPDPTIGSAIASAIRAEEAAEVVDVDPALAEEQRATPPFENTPE
jgi:hypothetical protein